MGKASAPPAPDYEAAARATAQGNLAAAQQATQANRPNQYTPWGSSTWSNDRQFDQAGYDQAMQQYNQAMQASQQPQASGGGYWAPSGTDGGADAWVANGSVGTLANSQMPTAPNRDQFYSGDNWSQTTTLSPQMQALFDQGMQLEQGLFGTQNAALGRVNETLGQGFDTSSLPAMGSVYDPNLATNNAQELLMRRLAPEMDRNSEALRAQLANQGITQGSQAYANAMDQMNRQRNDLSTQAALQGIGLGMQQQGMMFDQSGRLRNNALAEQAYLRSLPMNEFNALRTGTQVGMPQFPGFSQQATTGGPDLLGAAQGTYNAQLGAANAQNAASSNMMGGLFGIGGSLLGAPSSSILGGLFGLGG